LQALPRAHRNRRDLAHDCESGAFERWIESLVELQIRAPRRPEHAQHEKAENTEPGNERDSPERKSRERHDCRVRCDNVTQVRSCLHEDDAAKKRQRAPGHPASLPVACLSDGSADC